MKEDSPSSHWGSLETRGITTDTHSYTKEEQAATHWLKLLLTVGFYDEIIA